MNSYFGKTWNICKKKLVHKGCSYGGELARLGGEGLARLGEMIFILRSYGIFYPSSFTSLEKDCLIK